MASASSKNISYQDKRVGREEALDLLSKRPLGQVMALAHAERMRRHPLRQVTFVFDTNPNYTNVCVTCCRFCAFWRHPGDPDAYTCSPREIAERAAKAHAQGATTVLLQGGNNPQIRLKDWIGYIRAIRKRCPRMHIHPFSPAEYYFMAQQEKLPVRAVLEAMYAEGIRTLPGGGAEILSEPVRRRIAPHKATTDQWLSVCETAHEVGFRTTATMMYGHVESDADIVDHLLRVRGLQDRTGGVTSFIPWSFKPGGSPLGRTIGKPVHPAKYVRIIAVARLVLDNIEHIQSSWFSENIAAGQLGLLAGADDFGGLLLEENVHKQAGHARSTTVEDVKTIIRRSGFTPAQRDSNYQILSVFDEKKEKSARR